MEVLRVFVYYLKAYKILDDACKILYTGKID